MLRVGFLGFETVSHLTSCYSVAAAADLGESKFCKS
jgi:hypothetical protein